MCNSISDADRASFDLDRIRRETCVVGIDYHDTIGSTNTRALELASSGDVELPLLVLTDAQLAGRGRGSNQWWSAIGALTFSLLFDPEREKLRSEQIPLIALASGLAVAETVDSFVPAAETRLKWPNDVYLNGRKVCGILSEVAPTRATRVVVGIGVNLNNSVSDAPESIRALATSLSDFARQQFDRTEFLVRLLGRLFECLRSVAEDQEGFADRWRSRCWLQGRTVQIQTGRQTVTGVCQSIDDHGALLLQTEAGVQRCFGGTVTLVL